MKLAITGATGYIGDRLLRQALANGHEVVALSRRAPASPACDWLPFDLGTPHAPDLPADVDAVIHLAATTDTADLATDCELAAAQQLIAAASRCGALFVFVSSQTARQDAPTGYGRSKWLIEQETIAAGGLCIRPGQVYGGPERALFGTLVSTVRRLPVLPAFWPAPHIQPIHVDDLCTLLLTAASRRDLAPGVLCAGAPVPVSFTDFLQTIARQRLGRPRLTLPLPCAAIRLAASSVGASSRLRFSLDRLLSLFALPPMPGAADDLQQLGITLRPLADGMTRSGNGTRRALLREGVALLTYVLRSRPAAVLVRRYVRAIEQVRGERALMLPDILLQHPALLALLDCHTPSAAPLVWRLNAAVVLAEASPQGAQRCLGIGAPTGFLRATLTLTRAVLCEAAWRAARLLLLPLLQRIQMSS